MLFLTFLIAGATPLKLAVPNFQAVGVEQALVDAWAERLVTLLGTEGDIKVISSRDIGAIVGFERQRELTGCTDGRSSCLVELAGALGVDAILSGTLARSEKNFTATLRALKTTDGSVVWSATERLRGEDQLQDWLDAQAEAFRHSLRASFGQAAATAVTGAARASLTAESSGPSISWWWLPSVAGLVLGGASVGLLVASRGQAGALRSAQFESEDAVRAAASAGRNLETAGYVLVGAAVVAIAISAVMLVGGWR